MKTESPHKLIPFTSSWSFQYPSGTTNGGMLEVPVNQDLKSKYIYRDGKIFATHDFSDEVSAENTNYFKVGIYYQNKNSPKIFSEVFVRDLKIEI